MKYQYHHIGIPITEPRDGERYSPTMDMYTSGEKSLGGFSIIVLAQTAR